MAEDITQLKVELNDLNVKCQLARDNEIRFALQRSRLEAERAKLLVRIMEAMAATPAAPAVALAAVSAAVTPTAPTASSCSRHQSPHRQSASRNPLRGSVAVADTARPKSAPRSGTSPRVCPPCKTWSKPCCGRSQRECARVTLQPPSRRVGGQPHPGHTFLQSSGI